MTVCWKFLQAGEEDLKIRGFFQTGSTCKFFAKRVHKRSYVDFVYFKFIITLLFVWRIDCRGKDNKFSTRGTSDDEI